MGENEKVKSVENRKNKEVKKSSVSWHVPIFCYGSVSFYKCHSKGKRFCVESSVDHARPVFSCPDA